MPYVQIQITDEGASDEQKAALIAGTTQLLVDVLDKDPTTTFVVIEEVPLNNWGIGGLPVQAFRQRGESES